MFFILSKIFYFMIQPLNVVMVILFVGWLMIFKKSRPGQRLIGTGLLVLYLVSSGFVSAALIVPLERRFPNREVSERIDGIIVLAGGFSILKSGTVQFGTLNRIVQGLAITRQHPEAKLIFSGGSGSVLSQAYREADYMKAQSVLLGISPERILIDRKSRNTRENALETANLLKDYNQKNPDARWVLITSAFHMPRAIGCFRMAGIDPIPYSVDYLWNGDYKFMFLPSPDNLINSRTAIKEWMGLIAYRLSHYTDEFFPRSLQL